MRSFPKPKRKKDVSLLKRRKETPCCVCGHLPPSDPSHVKSRGSGGPDVDWNVVPHCRRHHEEWHRLGSYSFCVKYPRMAAILAHLGWFWLGVRLCHPLILGRDNKELH